MNIEQLRSLRVAIGQREAQRALLRLAVFALDYLQSTKPRKKNQARNGVKKLYKRD